ncbi:MAG: hypothetical protein HKP46_11065 [Myxococcales bacterium]|nr:hypothetical protein [Myxococcales bacterium]
MRPSNSCQRLVSRLQDKMCPSQDVKHDRPLGLRDVIVALSRDLAVPQVLAS